MPPAARTSPDDEHRAPAGASARERGFTLIEAILALALLGIVGLFVTVGLLSGMRAYVFAREMARITQEVETALGRVQYEFTNINGVQYAASDRIDFTTSRGGPFVSYRIYRDAGAGQVLLRVTDGNGTRSSPLLKNLAPYSGGESFLAYVRDDGGAWSVADGIRTLGRIELRIFRQAPGEMGSSMRLPFALSVNPRNNGIPNGPPRGSFPRADEAEDSGV